MLKKSLYTLVGFIGLNGSLRAQSLSMGPMVGGNLSSFSGPSNSKGLVGANLGGIAKTTVSMIVLESI